MKLIDIEKNALSMARTIHRNFGFSDIGIIGGTISEKSKDNDFIRISDRCLISKKGFCNINCHKKLQPLLIDEYDIPYRLSIKTLREILSRISYASGLAVANPIVRLLMYKIALENIHDCTLNDLRDKPRLPVVNWVEPETASGLYSVSLEDFRGQEKRPNWCLIVSGIAEKCKYFTKSKDGYYTMLSSDKMAQYLSRFMISCASGVGWHMDFGTLTVTTNPENPDRKIVIAGGNHWPGTLGINAFINLVEKIPQINISFTSMIESMAWLGEVVKNEKLENFQAIFRVTENIKLNGTREIDVYIIGVFSLPY